MEKKSLPSLSEHVLDSLRWRYAVKFFDPTRTISAPDWETLSESLRLAPSSYGLQPWKFVVVQNPELRQALRAVSFNQPQVTDCSHYVVIVAHERTDEAHIDAYLHTIAETRGVTHESLAGFRKAMIGDVVTGATSRNVKAWAQRQCYLAMGFLMQTAASLRIDSCPLEGFLPAEYNRLLGFEGPNSHWGVVAAVALGYRSPADPLGSVQKVRFPASRVIEVRN